MAGESVRQQPQQRSPVLTRRKIARILEVPAGGRLRLRWRLTRSGAGFLIMLLVLGVVAANPGLNLLLLLFGLGAGLLLSNAILSRRQVRSIEVRRILPDVAAVHRPVTVRYEVTNHAGWTTSRGLWIVDGPGESPSGPPVLAGYVEAVPPHGTVLTEVQVIPAQRGIHRLHTLCVASKFPFGLVCRLRCLDRTDRMLVWPALWTPRFDWLGRTPRAAEVRPLHSNAWHPGTDEFFGIREYRPGDNTRWIHWRRSASLDRVMVREMAQTSPGHVTLALETVTAGEPADRQTLDDLISAAASLACDAMERGWHVGLIANSRPQVVLPPAGGRAMRSRLLYELATLAAGRDERLAQVLENWPGGPAWAGRTVLLHPSASPGDAMTETAAARLAGAIGAVALVGPAELDTWFDRTAPAACPSATDAGAMATPQPTHSKGPPP